PTSAPVRAAPPRLHSVPVCGLATPALISLAWTERASAAAAHPYPHICRAHEFVCDRLWKLAADVQADLTHRLDHPRIERAGRFAAGRADVHTIARMPFEQRRRHLAPTSVVHANEENLRSVGLHRSLGYV